MGGYFVFSDEDPAIARNERRKMFDIVKRIQEGFEPEEAEAIVQFLRDFGFYAVGLIANLFFSAREKGYSVSETIDLLMPEWRQNWKDQPELILGDPNAGGEIGERNRISLNNLHVKLGIPLLEFDRENEIPKGAFISIDPQGFTREVSSADNNGIRTISFHPNKDQKLEYKAKILKLKVGENMVVYYVDQYDFVQFPVQEIK